MIHTYSSCHPMNPSVLPSGKTHTRKFIHHRFGDNLIGGIGSGVWTDGKKFYYSSDNTHFVLNGDGWKNKVWEKMSWGGVRFYAQHIWSDDNNIYASQAHYSNNALNGQYVLNKDTLSWQEKKWNGFTAIDGDCVWTDGTNIYYSYDSNQYILNGDTWVAKVWSGYAPNRGYHIWGDGTNIYYSAGTNQYVLNGDTWVAKTWGGLTEFTANARIWTDGTNIYHTDVDTTHILNGNTWQEVIFDGRTPYFGSSMWTDGKYIYNDEDFLLLPSTAQLYSRGNSAWKKIDDLEESIKPSGTLGILGNNKVVDVSKYAQVQVTTAEPYDAWDASLLNATLTSDLHKVGNIYKYTGETTDTYEHGALYILEEVSE